MIRNKNKRVLYFAVSILINSLVLNGCAAPDKGKLPSIAFITATNDADIPDSSQPASQNNAETPVNLLGEILSLNNYRLAIPLGWYFSEVNRPNMHGWIFTSQDPSVTLENGFIEWAGAFWAITPFPAGTNPDEFTSSLQNQNFNSGDFSALLLAPEQAGMVDLTDAEATLNNVEISSWGGQPCLIMKGSVIFTGSDNLSLDTKIVLMANNQDFISYYQFSNTTVSTNTEPLFEASFNSFVINP